LKEVLHQGAVFGGKMMGDFMGCTSVSSGGCVERSAKSLVAT
jgi:hypothetical protein